MHDFRAETLDKGPLTEREAEILRLICEARSDKDIAALLDISINTVLHHITHIYAKLQIVESRLNRRLVALRVALARGPPACCWWFWWLARWTVTMTLPAWVGRGCRVRRLRE